MDGGHRDGGHSHDSLVEFLKISLKYWEHLFFKTLYKD